MKYLRIWSQFIRYSLIQAFAYRMDLVMRFIGMVIIAAVYVFILSMPFRYVDSIVGWTKDELILILGLFYISNGVSWFFFRESVSRLENRVNTGSLDGILLKPINAQFFVSLFDVDLTRLVDIFIGFAIVVYVLVSSSIKFTLMGFLFGVIVFACGVLIVYSIFFLINALCFWTTETYLEHVAAPVFVVTRYPVDIWGRAARFLLYWIIPLGLITTLPAAIMLGKIELWYVVPAILVTAAMLFFARVLWLVGLRNYSSVGC